MRKSMTANLVAATLALAVQSASAWGAFAPWDAMTGDNWIVDLSVGAPPAPRIYTVNSNFEYRVAFAEKKTPPSDGARGLNVRFFGEDPAHHVKTEQTGDFDVVVLGKNDRFGSVLVMVAIDAAVLPGDFACTLNGYAFDNTNDFTYYDPAALGYDTGRPSGYYSLTNPASDAISPNFTKGMVTILAIENLDFTRGAPLTVDYSFTNLPGEASFSLYGASRDDAGNLYDIYHTNRTLEDLNDANRGVSTLTVTPEPASMTILACTSAALLSRRRRRGRSIG